MTHFRDRQIWGTGSGNSAIWRRNLVIKKTVRKSLFETKAAVSFLMPQGVLCLKLLAIRLHLFGWRKMAKIDVYRSLLPSDHVIG